MVKDHIVLISEKKIAKVNLSTGITVKQLWAGNSHTKLEAGKFFQGSGSFFQDKFMVVKQIDESVLYDLELLEEVLRIKGEASIEKFSKNSVLVYNKKELSKYSFSLK